MSKDIETDISKSDNSNNNENVQKATADDSIYQFWKKQPGFSLALFSTIIAICSFVIKAELHLARTINLRHWGITGVNVANGYDNELYTMAIIAFGIAIYILTITFVDSTLTAFLYNQRLHKRLKLENQKNSGSANEKKKKTKSKGKSRKEKKSPEKADKAENKKNGKIVIVSFVFVVVVWAVLLYCAQGAAIKGPITNELVSLVSIISASILLIIISFIFALFEFIIVKNQFKKNDITCINQKSNIVDAEYPIRKIADFRISQYLTNQKIRSFIFGLLIAIIVVIPFSLTYNSILERNQKEFQIYKDHDSDEVYVLVYRSDTMYYFDKAEETDANSIMIYTDSQRILKVDDMILETVTYENVTITP